MTLTLLKRLVSFHSVPPHIIVLTAVAPYIIQVGAILQGWPLWAIVLATVIPWLAIFTRELVWTYRHYHWLALFYALVVTQGAHTLEHVAQVTQIHLLGLTGAEARGVIGVLDLEWVHFLWNSWVILAVALLLVPYRRNAWLWLTLLFAGWHQLEHTFIMSVFLGSGQAGTPGPLALGGALGGGLPLKRPDLHFVYNLVETTALVIAFVVQVRQTYNEWLTGRP